MSGAGLLLLLELGEMSVAHAVMWRKACATMAHDSLQLEVMKPQKPEPGKKSSQDDPANVGMTPIMCEAEQEQVHQDPVLAWCVGSSRAMREQRFSAQKGSLDCVRRLLQARADINAVEEDGWSALHFASKEGHVQVLNRA
ncbi:Caskin-2 [Durusdinium trenchii]|uniref:Caskin-2 n=1 Tax=Durusdinium trenchii TaxID=1381693 RepID=A0ABP0P247_9DINO